MTKQIILIIGILLLASVSAVDLQAGETYEIDLGLPYSYYEIVRNSTEVDIDVTLNGTIASITPSKYMNDGSFDIVFYTEEKEIIIEVPADCPSCGVGGGGRTVYKNDTIFKDRLIKVCSDEIDCINETDIEDELDVEPEKLEEDLKWALVIFIGSTMLIIFCFMFYGYIKKRKANENKVS